jgi:hypothetical protein
MIRITEQIPDPGSLISRAYFNSQRANAGLAMCEKCADLDRKIEHYERLRLSIADQVTVERIKELVAQMKAQKADLHRTKSPRA